MASINQETGTQLEADGPVELPASSSSQSTLFAVDNNPPSPLQVATNVLLTGAACRAKELRVRSTGLKKIRDVMKEEAPWSLKAIGVTSIEPGGRLRQSNYFLAGLLPWSLP